ncbi:LLM class flavin-dependent oxidoreductase [Bradyrhizobium sp. U87765 SZCCT0131]|uniref:LLM class flavin-dependent oxidoreductase n=1 Tax=unclassified Bradyrhizobium TaxID=2631580 RepID=UPI001BA7E2E7|nr:MULTISPECIES: LLM class flavin-dependent oxidoreductase [unclassified Bradyrhizobium]MBR1218214.1 LLM class flavin-dependent oxidoreductase [Bradyrhizobium sp. U87765 SZCCT0131]MBR1260840.1 LLM class flavin-dependent oxidoreductase [Bradyrhizobium sp. U87765 SZCCT0134]MBR1303712.1 LLM class flavin-dependent oxidoreductase [Bradyrhizobium sp. U87765 SZCCT0110]MBR1319318.1 LLM class flavin-dependent oxidoreductase [Bradyrhizobium sp. U87765 SZCCT0109]MBR1347643.1 LLM class flavin-dependent ox
MTKQLRLNAFTMNTVGHLAPGLWTHPRDRSRDYKSIRHWAELARTLERGLFDAIFIADVIGVYDTYHGNLDGAVRNAIQLPINDPLQLIPAMALVTEHLGFGVTSSVTYEHPYPFARRMSTLDHLTGGRAAWNVVTSYLDSGARAIGLPHLAVHDDRYDVAEEYLDVCYKLWERSWDDDAVIADTTRGVFADPAKVHAVHHHGRHFHVDGIHLSEPSPQRTPVIFQAGASRRGRQFAGRHAEAVFVSAPTQAILKSQVDAVRASAAAQGRHPDDIVVFSMHTAIVGETDADAHRKYDDYRRHVRQDGALTLLSGWTGIDLGKYRPDEPLRHVTTNAGQSAVEVFSSSDPARSWTIRELAEWVSIGARGPVSVGSPSTVADDLQAWAEATGVDGFNLGAVVIPETFTDAAELLVPELQRRGAFKTAYAPGTFREKLFGRTSRLDARHPGTAA